MRDGGGDGFILGVEEEVGEVGAVEGATSLN